MKKLIFLILFLPRLIFGQDNPNMIAYQSMGSSVKAMSIGVSVFMLDASNNMTDGQLLLVPVYLQKAATITGVMVFMGTQGVYTADNNNKVGLYTVSGGTATLVASCADDGNLWKATANTFIIKAFSSTYAAGVGVYYIGLVYNSSAQTTAPKLACSNAISNAGAVIADFTNSNILSGYVAATDLTTPLTMNTLTASTLTWWVAIY